MMPPRWGTTYLMCGLRSVTLDSDVLLRALLEELSPSQAAKVAAHVTGGKRSELYEAALRLGK